MKMKTFCAKPKKLLLLIGMMLIWSGFGTYSANGSEAVYKNSLGMELIKIHPGTFLMGSPPDEIHRDHRETQHPVTISKPFYIQSTEVTLKQWRAIMGKKWFGSQKGSEHLPKLKVSWYDSQRFIKKLNKFKEGTYRLPTEAQWEYAARAGSTSAFSWGEHIDCTLAMYGNNSKKATTCLAYNKSRDLPPDQPAPVRQYPPNAWGLYDMHGNVWEWIQDWYGPYTPAPAVDPQGPFSGPGRARRGGSWFKHGDACRSANRSYGHPASKFQTTGFRLVWTPETDQRTPAPSVDYLKLHRASEGR